jgi:hypothetical protein
MLDHDRGEGRIIPSPLSVELEAARLPFYGVLGLLWYCPGLRGRVVLSSSFFLARTSHAIPGVRVFFIALYVEQRNPKPLEPE